MHDDERYVIRQMAQAIGAIVFASGVFIAFFQLARLMDALIVGPVASALAFIGYGVLIACCGAYLIRAVSTE